jgi:hypothetical protein
VGLHDDLAHYLLARLSGPDFSVRAIAADELMRAGWWADLLIIDWPPSAQLPCPMLWLADLDRCGGLTQIGPQQWRMPMPITSHALLAAIRSCLRLA